MRHRDDYLRINYYLAMGLSLKRAMKESGIPFSAKGSRDLNEALRDFYFRKGAPERIIIRRGSETLTALNGSLTGHFEGIQPNKFNELQQQVSVPRVIGHGTLTQCSECGAAFPAERKSARFCSPQCRKRAFLRRKAETLVKRAA